MEERGDKYKSSVELHGEPAELGPAQPLYSLRDVKKTLKLCRRFLKLMARRDQLSPNELETRLAHLEMFRENIEIAYKEQLGQDRD